MRRVALVGSGAEGDAAAAWLDLLPGMAAVRYPSIGHVAFASTDLFWLHGTTDTGWETGLLDWLATGGRALATLGGARLLYDIGLEPVAPVAGDQPTAAPGLAAFGPHPLFAGPGHGIRWEESASPTQQWVYRDRWPAAAQVVAVAWTRAGVDPSCALAWEQRAGDGGVLCIGAGAALAHGDACHQLRVRRLLATAITGNAVPHRDRVARATTWPAPDAARGAGVRFDDAAPIPRVPDFSGEWPAAAPTPLDEMLAGDRPWRHAGRRLLALGTASGGLHEAWAHPVRLLTDVSLSLVDRAVAPATVRAGPNGVERSLPVGAYSAHERILASLELPVLVWELVADGDIHYRVEWTVDLRRTAPYSARAPGQLVANVSDGGRRAWIGSAGSPVQAVFAVDGGRFECIGNSGVGVRMACTGTGRCRMLCVAAEDEADLDRTLGLIARRGVSGLQRQREQHLDRLLRYGAAIETPDAAVDAAFRRAVVEIDSALAESPSVGRSVANTGDPVRAVFTASEAMATALAALAVGNTDVARDVLRFLHATRYPDGRAPERHATSGLVLSADAEAISPDALAAGYLAWTGDVGPYPTTPDSAVAEAPAPDPTGTDVADALSAAAGGSAPDAATLVTLATSGLWGITPDAPGGLVQIRPSIPARWPAMAFRRLRVGRTQLDLELRRRPGRIVARIRRIAGPPVTVDVALRGVPVASVTLADEPLGSGRARFEADGEHEVVFHEAP